MARGQQNKANQVFNETQGVVSGASSRAGDLYSQILPQFQQEVNNPQGFSPTDLAKMRTGAEQSTGGAVAGAVGQGELEASRRRNAGGFAPALDEAAREGSQALSQTNLSIDERNALLKEAQRQAGLAGETGLYGTQNEDVLRALGLGTNAVNAGTAAGQSGWFQNFVGLMNALKPGGSTGAGGSTIGFG